MIKRAWVLALLLPLELAAQAGPARVTGLRVAPEGGTTVISVDVAGPIASWTEMELQGPPRLVVDVNGARPDLPAQRFDALNRGGVAGIRVSQFAPGVVRVVIDLERGSVPYTVTHEREGLRVHLRSRTDGFPAWSSAGTPPAAPAPTVAALQVPQQQQQQQRITVSFQDADIRDVLATFAEFTRRSIVPGSQVQGAVNATIRDQPWDLALETILRSHGLAAEELPSGIIRVDAFSSLQQRETQEPLVTRAIRINYVPVTELIGTLDPLRSERGRITAAPSTNTLIITDVGSVVESVAMMITQLDVPTPQVSIQAKIIFVNRTDVEELGVTYDLKDSRGSSLNRLVQVGDGPTEGGVARDLVLVGGNSVAALGNANVRVQGPQLQTVISLLLGRFTLISFIDALQAAELSDVQAAPLITTLDNQQAEIRVGERTPIRVVDVGAPTAGGGAGAPRASAQLVETGIILRVTPHITADRRILMDLHAERSSAQPAATDIGVIFQEQRGQTRLMVSDGETAVIGGLTVTEVYNARTGIPYLMNIPVLGRLFRTDRRREQKRDLLILVTPHIVDARPG
jgi:type IV pilus assembly protein PilQ